EIEWRTSVFFRSTRTRLELDPLRGIYIHTIDVKNPVQMRTIGAASGTCVTKYIAARHGCPRGHHQSRHVQVHGFESLPMIDSDSVAKNIKLFREYYYAGGDRANRLPFWCSLIHAAMIFAGGLSVVETFHPEWRRDAAWRRSGEWILPQTCVRYGITKTCQQSHFLRCRTQRFN